MKKGKFVLLFVIGAILVSCGATISEVKLDKFDITLSAPAMKKAPEYKALSSPNMIGRYDFRIGERRINVEEMEASIFPENLKMLTEAISSGSKFKGMVKGDKYPDGTMQCANGAFGVIYSKQGSKKEVKDYVFYFKKGDRYFRVVPVFNNDLDDLDQQLAAIESMK